jgi:transposase
MAKRRVFTREFKEEAVTLARTSGRTQTDIANSLGVDINMLSRWKRESEKAALDGKIKAFPGKGKARDEEMARLRKENVDLRESNEILKKAMAIFTVRKPR